MEGQKNSSLGLQTHNYGQTTCYQPDNGPNVAVTKKLPKLGIFLFSKYLQISIVQFTKYMMQIANQEPINSNDLIFLADGRWSS